MSTATHPARQLTFDDLLAGLRRSQVARAVARRFDKSTGLSIWIYTNACVFDDLWDDFSRLARGLVLHEDTKRVVATPFPKFFNAGEKYGEIPEGPFETFEKLDGSLIILFWWDGSWRAATKGAFDSEQARWAQARIADADLSGLERGATYLLEAIYPENRIVVAYDEPALVLLSGYRQDGSEFGFDELTELAARVGWRTAKRHVFASVADMVAHAETLPVGEEGFVARWQDGTRLKIKGAEYRRMHALISRITPLALWEMLAAGDDLEQIKRSIPEEFWSDFDAIVGLLEEKIADFRQRLEAAAAQVASLSDKELGLSLNTYPQDVRGFLFTFRKGGWPKVKDRVIKAIRPTGNELPGYTPSYAMNRVLDEAV